MSNWPINQPFDKTILDAPVDILASYHYFTDIDIAEIQSWGTRIIGDSGAFSTMSLGKTMDREDFHAWAKKWEDNLFWTAALDVIGDADATYRNWVAARQDGLELVPTVHYGEDTKALDRFAEEGATLVGLGGLVPYSSEKDRIMRWVLPMFRHARDHHPQVRFHGWGLSHPYLVDNLPWWSTDSSGFSSCFRFGTLRLFIPREGRFRSVELNGRDIAKYAKLLRDVYGADWKEISRSTPENRRPLGRVAIRAVQLYAKWLQGRQRVTPPKLLADKVKVTGPRVTLAPGTDLIPSEPFGPLQVGAAAMNEIIRNSLNPNNGPLQISAWAPTGGQFDSISPRKSFGPLQVSPMASGGNASPATLLSPQDSEPLQVASLGSNFSAQGMAVTPGVGL